MTDRFAGSPQIMRDFLFYMLTIKGRSERTVNGYYIDLRTFFRFQKRMLHLVPNEIVFEEISIDDIDLELLKKVTLSDIYEFLNFSLTERSNNASTRARKVSSIRSFYKYLTNTVNLLEENPTKNLETPTLKKTIPKYLTLEQSFELLSTANQDFSRRDFCMVTLFINCGMRLSELVGINLNDIQREEKTVRLLGKGNKERIVYLNDACLSALEAYWPERLSMTGIKERDALFLSSQGRRITTRRVEQIVEKMFEAAGLSNHGFSPHKLRHTAATLMYQHGNVDVRILQEILGHANLGTTQIYTHISNKQMEDAAAHSPLASFQVKKKKTEEPEKE